MCGYAESSCLQSSAYRIVDSVWLDWDDESESSGPKPFCQLFKMGWDGFDKGHHLGDVVNEGDEWFVIGSIFNGKDLVDSLGISHVSGQAIDCVGGDRDDLPIP